MTFLCHYVITRLGEEKKKKTVNLVPKPELFLPYIILEALGLEKH